MSGRGFFHNSNLVAAIAFMLFGLSHAAAYTAEAGLTNDHSKTLEITFGVFRPPYVFEKRDEGLDVEMTLAIFERMHRKVKTNHSTNQRGWKEIESGRVDALVGVSPEKDQAGLFYSAPILFYDNVAISKTKKKIRIQRVSDLKDLRFLSFEKAQKYLGPEYEEVMRNVKRDTDVSSQRTQNKLFWTDKIDVVILDLNVFRHYQKELKGEVKTSDEVTVHRIFSAKANPRCVVFRDRAVRDDFDRALSQIKADGTFQRIFDKYVNPGPRE